MMDEEAPHKNESVNSSNKIEKQDNDDTKKDVPWYLFSRYPTAIGYTYLRVGRATVAMSNVFLATALVYLASKEADCIQEENNELVKDCPNKVYGFRPAALIANIAVISGLLGAFCMPIVGSIIDHTQHRKKIGVFSALLLIVIQTSQIFISYNNWFAMAILQAIAAFVVLIQLVTTYAYLPEICDFVGQDTMRKHATNILVCQSSHTLLYLLVVVGIATVLNLGDVLTARYAQAVNVVWVGILFVYGWYQMPEAKQCHELPPGRSLFTQGFVQIYQTIKLVKADHPSLYYFFVSTAMAEAGLLALLTLAVTYFDEHVGMTSSEIGILIFILLIFFFPGSWFSGFLSRIANPITCFRGSMMYMAIAVALGAFCCDWFGKTAAYIWVMFLGFGMGWFYPVETLLFSKLSPPGQYDAELSGLFAYSYQIFAWAPPLVFSTLVEVNVKRTYSMVSLSFFFVASVILAYFMGPWQKEENNEDEDKKTSFDVPKEIDGTNDVSEDGSSSNNNDSSNKEEIMNNNNDNDNLSLQKEKDIEAATY